MVVVVGRPAPDPAHLDMYSARTACPCASLISVSVHACPGCFACNSGVWYAVYDADDRHTRASRACSCSRSCSFSCFRVCSFSFWRPSWCTYHLLLQFLSSIPDFTFRIPPFVLPNLPVVPSVHVCSTGYQVPRRRLPFMAGGWCAGGWRRRDAMR